MVLQRRTRRASICTSHRGGVTWRYLKGYSQGTHTGVILEFSQGYSESAHRGTHCVLTMYSQGYSEDTHRGTLRDTHRIHRIRTGDWGLRGYSRQVRQEPRGDGLLEPPRRRRHEGERAQRDRAGRRVVLHVGVLIRGTRSGYSFGVLIRGTHRGTHGTDKDTHTGTRRGSSMHRARDACALLQVREGYSAVPQKDCNSTQGCSRVLKGTQGYSRVLKGAQG
jgi:hypothetical protein